MALLRRFRYSDRWGAIESVPAKDMDRARLELRDRDLEDYVSDLERRIVALETQLGL